MIMIFTIGRLLSSSITVYTETSFALITCGGHFALPSFKEVLCTDKGECTSFVNGNFDTFPKGYT